MCRKILSAVHSFSSQCLFIYIWTVIVNWRFFYHFLIDKFSVGFTSNYVQITNSVIREEWVLLIKSAFFSKQWNDIHLTGIYIEIRWSKPLTFVSWIIRSVFCIAGIFVPTFFSKCFSLLIWLYTKTWRTRFSLNTFYYKNDILLFLNVLFHFNNFALFQIVSKLFSRK